MALKTASMAGLSGVELGARVFVISLPCALWISNDRLDNGEFRASVSSRGKWTAV